MIDINITIPIVGAILGNIVGSIIGTFVYSTTSRLFLSFCVETGYTILGIVEQDYTLPDEVLKEMGIDIINYDSCQFDLCKEDTCEPDLCEPDICEPDKITPYTICRGVIGINRIGYFIQ